MWEYFMQKPFYDKGEIRRIGQIITPWPCFLIASTRNFISKNLKSIEKLFLALKKSCQIFENNSTNSIERISLKFHLNKDDAKAWFDKVNINPTNNISESTIETTIDALITANIIKKENFKLNSIEFLDRRIAKLIIDIKSMRLYNKPEILIALRNNLRVNHLSKGQIKYTDLLPFDQNHYYGIEVLDLAVNQMNLNQNNSTWIIQIGSNLAGCARYLAGKYHLNVLAIELQNDLSEAANELTDRCNLSEQVHHITGNFLNVGQHLQENYYSAIVSWLTILHFNQQERNKLFSLSYRLLKINSFFYCEDFIQIGNLTNEESQILEHDVYCRYLPTLDQYKQNIIEHQFHIIKIEDLTNDWKIFTKERLDLFQNNKMNLIQIHGEDIYQRLEYFYQSIVKLFQGNNVGGVRIIAIKQ
jgi:cyclopropane fatty-acyl-phospholipid synthase-like methyltransferase